MSVTRRSFLTALGIGTAAVLADSGDGRIVAEVTAAAPSLPRRRIKPLARDAFRQNTLESFLARWRITPAHLARECGYSRQHLLRIRMDRMEPTPRCAVCIVRALRRLSGAPVHVAEIFGYRTVVAIRQARWALLRTGAQRRRRRGGRVLRPLLDARRLMHGAR